MELLHIEQWCSYILQNAYSLFCNYSLSCYFTFLYIVIKG